MVGHSGPGVLVDQHHEELLGPVQLCVDISSRPRGDVTLGARDAGVRGDMISVILWSHDVTCGTTEGDRVHVGVSAITADTDDDEVDRGRDENNIKSMPEDGIVNTDFREEGRHLVG